MTAKFKNPYYVEPFQAQAEALEPAVRAWLQAQPGNKVITMTELRAGLPAIAGQLDRRTVNHIASMIGMECLNPEDPAP